MLVDFMQNVWSVASVVAVFATVALSSRGGISADERLKPCPDTPNCVSTLASDRMHAIAPLTYDGRGDDAQSALRTVIEKMPRSKIVADEPGYLHVEFRSLIFRFVDDVEFVVDDDAKVVHFRSAARMGRGDLGVNRRRMERIRRAFDTELREQGSRVLGGPAHGQAL